MQRLFIEKTGDALSSEAEAPGYGLFSGLGGILANKIIKKQSGGLWVRGTFKADGEWFSFDPGIASILYYDNTEKVQFHISEVRQIRLDSGIIKDIVVIEHTRGEFKFSCFGASELATTLQSYLRYVQSFNNLYPTR